MGISQKTISKLIVDHGHIHHGTRLLLHCPFCSAQYLDENESRQVVNCPYCQGKAIRAKDLEKYCEDQLEQIRKTKDLQALAAMLDVLGEGYMAFEYRRTGRALRESADQHQP